MNHSVFGFCSALGLLLVGVEAVAAPTPNTLADGEKAAGWRLLFDGKITEG